MNRRSRAHVVVLLVGLVSAWAPAVRADEPEAREAVRQGNELFGQQKYKEAYEKYHAAAADLTDVPEILFNQAATFYKRGDYDRAIDLYEDARATQRADLDKRITFNLGNCHHQQAIKLRSDLPKAIGRLRQAARHYRDCLQVDPEFDNARYNLQLAKLLLKHLLDEQKKKEQQKKKDNKGQKKQDDKNKQKSQQKQSPQSQPDRSQDPKAGKDKQKKSQKRPSAEDRKKLRKEEAQRLLRHALEDARRRRQKRLPQQRQTQTPGRGTFKDW